MKGFEKLAVLALGVLAYKNRDRLGEWLGGDAQSKDPKAPGEGGGGLFDQMGGGLGDLLERFRNAGRGEAVDSWIGTGPNKPIERDSVEAAIDPDTLDALSRQTGLSRDEIIERLAVNLPDVVNDMTPEGRVPSEATAGEPTLLDPAPPRTA